MRSRQGFGFTLARLAPHLTPWNSYSLFRAEETAYLENHPVLLAVHIKFLKVLRKTYKNENLINKVINFKPRNQFPFTSKKFFWYQFRTSPYTQIGKRNLPSQLKMEEHTHLLSKKKSKKIKRPKILSENVNYTSYKNLKRILLFLS